MMSASASRSSSWSRPSSRSRPTSGSLAPSTSSVVSLSPSASTARRAAPPCALALPITGMTKGKSLCCTQPQSLSTCVVRPPCRPSQAMAAGACAHAQARGAPPHAAGRPAKRMRQLPGTRRSRCKVSDGGRSSTAKPGHIGGNRAATVRQAHQGRRAAREHAAVRVAVVGQREHHAVPPARRDADHAPALRPACAPHEVSGHPSIKPLSQTLKAALLGSAGAAPRRAALMPATRQRRRRAASARATGQRRRRAASAPATGQRRRRCVST